MVHYRLRIFRKKIAFWTLVAKPRARADLPLCYRPDQWGRRRDYYWILALPEPDLPPQDRAYCTSADLELSDLSEIGQIGHNPANESGVTNEGSLGEGFWSTTFAIKALMMMANAASLALRRLPWCSNSC